uniref:Uncharacterized protein n=1 Tax=Malurus cyaneus samueli TaxID=2593467 RepID=A0A8C5TB77_9PASS
MKFNAAFRGEGKVVTWPSGSFEFSPGGKKKKQIHLFFRSWLIYLFKKLCRIFFSCAFFSLEHCEMPREASSSVTVCGRASLALAMLAGLEKQCEWFSAGTASAITAPAM